MASWYDNITKSSQQNCIKHRSRGKVPLGREGPGCVAAREDKSGTKGTKTLICPRFYIIPTDYCVRVCVCVAKSHAYDNWE